MSADDKAASAWDDYINQQQEQKIEELERELNAANQIIRQQQLLEEDNLRLTAKVAQLYEGAEEQKLRIKRLEEAGDALFELCDASPIQFELVDQIPQRLKAWEEAKEDKP